MLPGGAAISKDKRSLQMPRPASSSLHLPPLEKGMPHTLPWAKLHTITSHPHPTYTNNGEMGAGVQLIKHCLYPPPNSDQE